MEIALLAVILLVVLALVVYVIVFQPRAEASRNADLRAQLERDRAAQENALEIRLLESQSEVAQKQTETFFSVAKSHFKQESESSAKQLAQRHEEIDKTFGQMAKELKSVREFVTQSDEKRVESIGQMTEMLTQSRATTEALRQDTQKLNEVLSGKQSRGKLGEGMAEDVLRFAGFEEGINYLKQTAVSGGTIPDFTFLLADRRTLNMDVKTPMDAFRRYLDTDDDLQQALAAKEFVRDTRKHVKEISTRNYVNTAEGTLDYVLMLIPHEQVYGFLHEQDSDLTKFALENGVVICSPLTLILILNVIRQSAESFRLETRTREIQKSVSEFEKQWLDYKKKAQTVDGAVTSLAKNWGELTGVRERGLERSMDKVKSLRSGADDLAPAEVEPEVLSLLSGDDR
jgi:DNA recombination protein RmuC